MTIKPFALAFLFTAFVFTHVNAQTATTDTAKIPHAYWVNMGFGVGTLGSLSANIGLQAEVPKRWLISASYQAEPNHIGTKTVGGGGHNVNIFTGNLLVGKVYKERYSLYSVSAGLSYVDMDIDDYYGTYIGAPVNTSSRRSTIGIPIVAQAYAVGGQFAGIGVSGYINLNTLQTTAGLQIHVALGRIQTHKPRY